ncbi:MOSC domain-containing protein [Rufibacter glacialis]|uniref:MOSC domain-containing protein n=1 Tax=Rufibacter glacialis TaxID=1259555 RepID=A0A5M8QMK0_9BACT|nr:MOSC N-terminal beta barrel domain-containing protein [Rufibacter glacialis]KAA6435833.1 MOSC domain-containing protein [Rufibacter glacialis]GGK66971.1 MOSC domain-containing protein [Rufibacter glacialis]
MPALVLSEIYIYPIKSLGGISLTSAEVEERGLQYDRRWMLIDDSGIFLTQRKIAEMALLQVALSPEGLLVTHKSRVLAPLLVPYEANSTRSTLVTIWDDICFAFIVSPEANAWFSEALGINCRLVYMPENSIRLIDPNYAKHNEKVSFSDGYPFLIIGQESLNDLNARLTDPVPMNRFRPNFVFTGGQPYAEEQWKTFKIGNVLFYGAKPCGRCNVTTIDQDTAQAGKEPLQTLASYQSKGNKVIFGMNLIGLSTGTVAVGDPISVMETASVSASM